MAEQSTGKRPYRGPSDLWNECSDDWYEPGEPGYALSISDFSLVEHATWRKLANHEDQNEALVARVVKLEKQLEEAQHLLQVLRPYWVALQEAKVTPATITVVLKESS